MNLALGTLAATLALSPQTGTPPEPRPDPSGDATPALEYALPELRGRCLSEPCAGSVLTDLTLDLGEPGGPEAGEARLLVDDRFYLGLHADGESRGLSFETTRWDVRIEHADDATGLGAEYRGRRLRLRAAASDHQEEAGDGQVLDLEAALRLSPDLEIVVAALEDDRTGFLPDPFLRPTSSLAVGALWQHGARLDLGGFLRSETVVTPAGLELDRQAIELEGAYEANRWSLDGHFALDETSGRIDRQEAVGDLRFSYLVTPRLVATAAAGERYDLDLGSVASRSELEVTYFATRFGFNRSAAAGRRTVELVRRARELGFNERRLHDDEGRRRLRQRLALSSAGDELATLIDDLYRENVDERNVPVAGIALRRDRDDVDGSELRRAEVFVAIPWPRGDGTRPWSHDAAATDFLRFTYSQTERDISRGFTTEGERLAFDVSLRRELGLRFSWEVPAATGLEFALRTQQPRRFLAQLIYRQGI